MVSGKKKQPCSQRSRARGFTWTEIDSSQGGSASASHIRHRRRISGGGRRDSVIVEGSPHQPWSPLPLSRKSLPVEAACKGLVSFTSCWLQREWMCSSVVVGVTPPLRWFLQLEARKERFMTRLVQLESHWKESETPPTSQQVAGTAHTLEKKRERKQSSNCSHQENGKEKSGFKLWRTCGLEVFKTEFGTNVKKNDKFQSLTRPTNQFLFFFVSFFSMEVDVVSSIATK